MTWRTAHGTGRNALVRAESAPVDELPAGRPGPARPAGAAGRGPGGRFAAGNPHAAEGGRSRAGKTRLASELGLAGLDADPAFAPYKRDADAFRRAQCAAVAASVGGGICGPGPSSIIASAALALAASRFLYDAANGDADTLLKAARLADQSRTALLTAHELAAREALARPRGPSRLSQLLKEPKP